MFLNLIKYSSLLVIGWIFGATIYNQDLKNLKNEFESKDTDFIHHQTKLDDNQFFSTDSDKHLLNQISYRLNNISITDSVNLSIIDSLIGRISLEDSVANSIYTNQSGYNTFVQSFNSHLLTQTGFLNEEKLNTIKDIYLKLEDAIRLDPNNDLSRHNYIILKSLHQSKDFNFQKAKELSDLVFEQLKRDLLSDTLRQKEFASKTVLKGLEEKTNTIKSSSQKKQCIRELGDSLNTLIDSSLLVDYQIKTIDSLRQYSNIDQGFVEALEAGKTREEIITGFYTKDYQELFGNSSVSQIKKVLKDKPLNKSLSEVLCKYLEEGCDQNSESEKDEKSDNKEDSQEQSEEQNGDSESEGDSEKEQGDKPGDKSDNGMEDYKDSKSGKQESQEQKNQEMSDKLEDYEKQRQQKEAQQQKQEGQPSAQKHDGENAEDQQTQNAANKEKLDKYNITPEQAEQALKKIQEQNEKHFKNKQRQGNEQNDSEDKPNW